MRINLLLLRIYCAWTYWNRVSRWIFMSMQNEKYMKNSKEETPYFTSTNLTWMYRLLGHWFYYFPILLIRILSYLLVHFVLIWIHLKSTRMLNYGVLLRLLTFGILWTQYQIADHLPAVIITLMARRHKMDLTT